MDAHERLIQRSGDLKRAMIDFITPPPYHALFEKFRKQQLGDRKEITPHDIMNTTDSFLFDYRLPDGRSVVEHFVERHPELPEDERKMVLSWKDGVIGVFEVQRQTDRALIVRNAVDELTYQVRSNVGPSALRPFRPGWFMIGRIVPVDDEWLMSGSTQTIPPSERQAAYDRAGQMLARMPKLQYRNPELLQRAWELQAKDHKAFVEYFGGDMIIVPGRGLRRVLDEYARYRVYEARDENGQTPAEIYAAEGRPPPNVPTFFPDAPVDHRETVGVLYDAAEGMWLLPDYGLLEESFARPELAKGRRHREAIRNYVESPNLPPHALRRLALLYPGGTDRAIAMALGLKQFSWERDGEALLRRHKPDSYDQPPLPSTTVAPEWLTTGKAPPPEPRIEAAQAHPGRNDPCPCGSGKKYKKCCGR